MFREGTAPLIQRADYTAPAFWIDTVDLTFDLDPAKTRVLNKMRVRRNADVAAQPLRLDGDAFDLEIFTTCNPAKNTKLMGLYVSNDSFFTQCEAEGFRRITYFLDRPDVMSSYSVTLRADKQAFPVLLSNGNLVEEGDLEEGRHFAKWVDPHKKPCYLFALVAGQFVCREQRVKAPSGKEHLLQVYVRSGDLDKTEHAMNSLMASIKWDEQRFNLSLDLERFMIVATSDFNMGAMENKGLNIFNTKFVLANSATATDMDYANIESVVGHEYFHNWTGNRVTCRDWFQLSLKEGLTVFRDQEFSQDLAAEALKDNAQAAASAKAVKRIEDVRLLRTAQFPEDAGPMAHPVRPDSYVEINNFYTVTIYEKGSEVVRMMQTLTSREGFAKGMSLYFERHDGQAVTCDDFAQAIADANPGSALATHLAQFKRWYAQAGTPRVQAAGSYNADTCTYTLTLSQSCPPSPGQDHKEPFVIPVQMGLLGADGREVLATQLLVLTESKQSFEFKDLALQAGEEPVPSLLRGFSAPVVLEKDFTSTQLLTLLAHDTDPFNQWEAAQRLCLNAALHAIAQSDEPTHVLDAALVQALRTVLRNPALDAAFKELVLTLPSETYMAEQLEVVDPQRIHAVREAMRAQLARELHDDWAWAFDAHQDNGAFRPDPVSSGRRALSGMALAMLCLDARTSGDVVWPGRTYQRFKDAHNMTDRFNALNALVQAQSVSNGHDLAADALQRFYNQFRNEALVMDKWFALQAGQSDRGGHVLSLVRNLMLHPDFHIKNPNRARSLIFSFCSANPGAFHRSDAAGYVFWSERVLELDAINPQVAARLARALDRWSKLAEPYRTAAHEAIKRVAAKTDLSNDVREVVSRALAN
jgi:aminopeptidase N